MNKQGGVLFGLIVVMMVVGGIGGQAEALVIGNPSAANGWNAALPPGAVGDPCAATGWDTTGAVSIRAFSSQKDGRLWVHTIDGSGLDATGLLHNTDPNNMGISDVNTYPNTVRGGTVDGYVWVEYDLGDVYELGQMWVWNYNELNWPHLGMNEVTVEYSTTGSTDPGDWTTIYDGEIPLAAGAGVSPSAVDLAVDFGGAAARYVVITTDDPPLHNHNPALDDCGLSEVRFNFPAAITVRASSSQPDRPALNTVNGSGIVDPNGLFHDRAPTHMWESGDLAASAANPNPGTVAGAHWIRFDFDKVYRLEEMWIWNYAEADFTLFGMKDVTIEYASVDDPGEGDWTTIFDGALPISSATNLGPDGLSHHEATIFFNGVQVKHVVVTAIDGEGRTRNFYPSFYGMEAVGLSEVRFLAIDPPQNCAEVVQQGYSPGADVNGDCYVNLTDLALVAGRWLKCVEPTDAGCQRPWE